MMKEFLTTYYLWIVVAVAAIISYVVVNGLKKVTFLPLTKKYIEDYAAKKITNLTCGVVEASGVAFVVIQVFNWSFNTEVSFLFAFLAGAVANITYIIYEKIFDGKYDEAGKILFNVLSISKKYKNVGEADILNIVKSLDTVQIHEKEQESVNNYTESLTAAIGIANAAGVDTTAQIKLLLAELDKLEECNFDCSAIRKQYAAAIADGVVTKNEADALVNAFAQFKAKLGY